MGGKNHQPCKSYVEESTRLSKSLSLAVAHLELANVELEDVLLAEMKGDIGSVLPIVSFINQSCDDVRAGVQLVDQLRAKMRALNYDDLPTLFSEGWNARGAELVQSGLVDQHSWDLVLSTMTEKGFYGNLDLFDRLLEGILEKSESLAQRISECAPEAERGELLELLEGNYPKNFKTEFAQLYTSWHTFNSIFLASSILSTEIWYTFSGFGRLRGLGRQAAYAK